MRGIREISENLHVKAFTVAEYDFFSRRFKIPLEQVFKDFLDAGLSSLPGGGAEVLAGGTVLMPKVNNTATLSNDSRHQFQIS